MSYVPLWVKSNYSFLEGASHPDELVTQAAELGLPALAPARVATAASAAKPASRR
jgi:DNA polymerase III alpha subunit